jgi:hypothetical protein
MYVEEMRHLLGCCESRQSTVTPFAQALHVLGVLEAAKVSSQQSGAPVAV